MLLLTMAPRSLSRKHMVGNMYRQGISIDFQDAIEAEGG